MARLIEGLDAARVAANLAEVAEEVDRAARVSGRVPAAVEILAAVKYVTVRELPVLRAAGISVVGENRAQDLRAKVAAHPDLFTWDFIGQLQSRKVRQIVEHVRLIHSLASESALLELERHVALGRPGLEVLLQVDLTGEAGKAGIAAEDVGRYIDRSPVPVTGLMTMPPLTSTGEDNRRWFAGLRELADSHHLPRLSMGTTQDFGVAVEEGATIVRIGTRLYDQS